MSIPLFKKFAFSFVRQAHRRAAWLAVASLALLALPARAATYTLNVQSAPIGYGVVTGYDINVGGTTITNGTNLISDPLNLGVELSVTASNAPTTIFSFWSGTLASSLADTNSRTTTLSLDASGSLTANFDQKSAFSVAVLPAHVGRGVTIPTGSTNVPRSRPFSVKAVSAIGYEFTSWTISGGSPVIANPLLADTTVIPGTASAGVYANFQLMPKLTVTAPLNGQITVITSSGIDLVPNNTTHILSIPTNEVVTVMAVPDAAKDFTSWIPTTGVVADPSNTTTTITMNKSKNVTFQVQDKVEKRTLILLAGANGTVDPAGTNAFTYNAPITITASPNPGYAFVKWTLTNGVGSAGAQQFNASATYVMDQNRGYMAHFTNTYTVTVNEPGGPGSLPVIFDVSAGASWSNFPPSSTIGGVPVRVILNGYTEGTGNVSPSSSALVAPVVVNAPPGATTNSALRWVWQKQYWLETVASGSGTISPASGWRNEGSTNIVTAIADAGFILAGWTVDTIPLSHRNPTNSVVMTGPKTVEAIFIKNEPDADNDGLPTWWEEKFGLDPYNTTDPEDGANGDPDHDGLSNRQEYLMAVTNAPGGLEYYMNPINADTDGDGMDDYFEAVVMAPTNLAAGDIYISAAMIKTGDKGPYGNPDNDFKWDTTNGYELLNQPLNNSNEWEGSDGIAPCTYFDVTGTLVFATTTVPRKMVRQRTPAWPAFNGTDDQSDPLNPNTDGDGFDDGYEFSWDKWQQVHENQSIQARTNWLTVTATVPDWNTDRRYNANAQLIVTLETLEPDFDWLYNPANGQATRAYSDIDEYQASTLSGSGGGTSNYYPIARVVQRPERWCTNPFMWDTDGDGLPDGWELVFGYDPWNVDTDRDGLSDGGENPDGDAYAILSVPVQIGDIVLSSNDVDVVSTNLFGDVSTNVVTVFATNFVGFVTTNIVTTTNLVWDPFITNYVPVVTSVTNYPPVTTNCLIFHYQVYQYTNYNPWTAWVVGKPMQLSQPFSNIMEFAGPFGFPKYLAPIDLANSNLVWGTTTNGFPTLQGVLAHPGLYGGTALFLTNATPHWLLGTETQRSTNPHDVDTDRDGAWDGWEYYFGYDPGADADGAFDTDQDGLSTWQEFIGHAPIAYWRSLIAAGATPDVIQPSWTAFMESWPNKGLPTDPLNPDTDNDQMSDSAEQGAFNYVVGWTLTQQGVLAAAILTPGGGLNPSSVDTDLDYLPDYWEAYWPGAMATGTNGATAWAGGMNGTVSDALLDYDSDGLYNYQEYMVGSCYQFQWLYNNGTWTLDDPDAVANNYDPYNFFDLSLSGGGVGDCTIGPGALAARATWDPAYWADRMVQGPYKRFTFLSAAPSVGPYNFSTCNPGASDTDTDGYDDFYEIYHNLNPVRGSADRVSGKVMGVPTFVDMLYGFPFDYTTPFRWGELPLNPIADFDQDGQVDMEEGLTPNLPAVIPYHHTDPSPYFVGDISSDGSWVNKFYKTGWVFGAAGYWYWNDSVLRNIIYPAAYLFTFEANEGYDTDNDMDMDGAEIVGNSPGATDPLDDDSPLRQRALYLDGAENSAARLFSTVVNPWTSFRAFTIEAWVRPTDISGDRVIVQRAGTITANNPGLPNTVDVHQNFRLGITNGIPYIGYDGYGMSWVYNIVVGSPNYRLATNRWAHLAGVFDAQNKRLTLYVNGEMAGSKSTQQIPFNGFVAGDPGSANTPLVVGMMLTLGAADQNPDGVLDGSLDNIKSGEFPWSGLQPTLSFPSFVNQFAGWVDEIRCWDGTRTQAEINSLRDEKLTRAMVNSINGVSTGNQNIYGGMGGTEVNPRLVYAYTFDGLPDPKQGVVPQGFTSALYPSDWPEVEWWGLLPMASTVYNNRQYVKWIQNIASHQPYDPPRDSKITPWLTVAGMTTNTLPNGTVVTNFSVITNFPNTANPYVFEYVHYQDGGSESHPQYTSTDSGLYGDLLPLGNVEGDEDVPMWDGKGLNAPINLRDQDGDGMPDIWEEAYGLNPFDPADGALDADGDGLTNQQEYQVGGDPFGIYSLDPNQILKDSEMDSDHDGLSNGLEASYGTHLILPDTDDDGILDGAEVQAGMNPIYSLSPAVSRVLRLTGDPATWLEGPTDQNRFLMSSFSVGAWIKLNTLGCTVLSCEPDPGIRNYRLSVKPNGVLTADFTSFDRSTTISLDSPVTALVPTGIWTHVAATFDFASRKFVLYYNGREVASLFSLTRPAATGYGPTRLLVGEGLNGDMDEVAIFSTALTEDRVLTSMNGVDLLGSPSLTAFYPFDDGTNGFDTVSGYTGWNTGHVQDFAVTNNDWMDGWKNGATLVGGAQVVQLEEAPVNINERDTDGDGLPDGWETSYGIDPMDALGNNGGAGDPDNDGLSNLYEYWAGTNPRLRDTDANGVDDGLEDSDFDGLTNLDEQDLYGTRPDMVDTDDDTISDFDETIGMPNQPLSGAVNAMSPPKQLSGSFDGTGYLSVPENERLQLSSWSVHAWVNPAAPALWLSDRMVVARREIMNSRFGGMYAGVNYEIGLKRVSGQIRPYVRFAGVTTNGLIQYTEVDGQGASEIRGSEQISGFIGSDEWSHILGSYDSVDHKLSLYINGELSTYRLNAFLPTGVGLAEQWIMKGRTTIGAALSGMTVTNGFLGYIDDVAILAGVVDSDGAWTAADKTKPLETTSFASVKATGTRVVKTQNLTGVPEDAYRPNQVLVRFKDQPDAGTVATRATAFKTALTRSFTLTPVHLLTITDGKSVVQKIAELKADPNVLYAEPNFCRTFNAVPNDPNFGSLWGLNNTGQSGGTPDADMDAPEAWDATKGSANIIVAVLDSGMETTHPDLANNVWVNTGEIAGNGIDDDGNGYIDDVNGFDFFNNDNVPDDPSWLSHGTHVSGTIGAVGNNGVGVAGVNWRVQLMACKVGDYYLSDSAIIAAFEYASRMGARVANCSFGGYYYSQAEYDAISAVNEAGMLVVCASGNDAIDTDIYPHYPSSFDLPNIISVAASTRLDELAYFSNFGLASVDVAAPGLDILSTMVGGGYGLMSGTSMASPHTAGLAALVASMYPTMSHLTWKQMLLGSVEKKPAFDGITVTGGRINARKAVSGGGAPVAYFSFNDDGVTVEDSAWANDWVSGFKHAGTWLGGAGFSSLAFLDSYLDTDGDSLPDWWEIANGLDPYDPSGANGGSGDADSDGLTNWNEYLAGTNPNIADSDHDGLTDKNEDSDNDGLTNLEEQNFGTDPGMADTDDDGYSDGQERTNESDPLDSWSPEIRRAVAFNGQGRLTVNSERDADSSVDWTVETWAKPASATATGILVRRAEKHAFLTTNSIPLRWVDYELGLSNGVPYVKYAYRDNLGETLITVSAFSDRAVGTNWVHLAGVRQFDTAELRLYVDGKEMGRVNPGKIPNMPVSGGFETTIGGGARVAGILENGFVGQIDAVRAWSYARMAYEIQAAAGVALPEFVNGVPDASRAPRRLFDFDDGGSSLQNESFPSDWKTGWSHAAEADGPAGSVSLVLSDFAPVNLDQDDDGITDYTELANGWYERRSDWPYVEKYLEFRGDGDVRVDERIDGVQSAHYALTTWTVETWVRPRTNVTIRLPLVARQVVDGNTNGVNRVTFEVGLDPNGADASLPRAYVKFNRDDAGFEPIELAGGFVPAGVNQTNWTHLAAVYDENARKLTLYVNGVIVGNIANVSALPYAPESGIVVFGGKGYNGYLKEIRIWNVARSAVDIEANYQMPILFSTSIQNSFNGNAQAYVGRPTVTNDGAYNYDYTYDIFIDDWVVTGGHVTHPFSLEAWVKMDEASAGGIIMERKVESGYSASGFLVNEGLRIEGDGHPTGYIEGWVTEYTPVYVATNGQRILQQVNAIDVLHRRPLTSEMDLRDGKWHHVAFVGDSLNMYMYIDGRLDTKTDSYYDLRLLGGTTFEGLFVHIDNEGSVLRAGGTLPDDIVAGAAAYHPMFDGTIDEPIFWNVDQRQDQVQQHMTYGLTRPDIQAGLQTIYPKPQDAIDDGRPHHRLVSYVIFDGRQDLPFIRDLVPNREPYIIMPRMLGGELLLNSMPPISVDPLRAYDAELRGYFACDDGGDTLENYIFRNDQSYAGIFYGDARFRSFNKQANPVQSDTDHDGIPDSWETQYGMDPEDPMDAYADADHDGLGNSQEYMAGSSPLNPMSLNGQTLDFFSVTGVLFRTVGEQVSDMDWIDDLWEVGYGLNPELFDSTGNGADSDGDGWSNLAEFQELLHWNLTAGSSNLPANANTAASVITENHPLSKSAAYSEIEAAFRADRLPQPEPGMQYQQRWNDPSDSQRYPIPELVFRFQYSGLNRWLVNVPFVVMAYTDRSMDIPDAVIKGIADRSASYPAYMFLNVAATNSATIEGNVREGQNWFWGFMDVNGDGIWQSATEPGGMSEAFNVRWGSDGPIDIPLMDNAPMGTGRFTWTADPLAQKYHVYIVDRNRLSAPTVLYQTFSPFRTFLHEGDVRRMKKLNKGFKLDGGYQWYVRAEYNNTLHDVANGFVYAKYANPLPQPKLLWPVGKARLRQSLDNFLWKMDPSVTFCKLVVRKLTGEVLLTQTFVPPARDAFGKYEKAMPIYIGDSVFQDGVYEYVLTVQNPLSTVAATNRFTIKTGEYPGLSYTLSGNLVYPGKVTNGNFIVEAYTSPGFGGVPAGRVIRPNTVTGSAWPLNKVSFTIAGLPKDTYYVKAYLNQNDSYPAYIADDFESAGWLAEFFYWPKGVDLKQSSSFPDLIKVLMRDTDSDQLADDWEYIWNKNLGAFGPGSLRGYVPALNGILNVFECYERAPLGLSPK